MSIHLFKDLETDRLLLKSISKEDRDFVFGQFSNGEVSRYLYDEEPFTDINEADELIDFYLEEEPRNQHRWILVRKDDGAKIGTCGFHCWDRDTARCEIGYDLSPKYWKMGYAREALAVILSFAREEMKLKRIDAHIYPENIASAKVAKNSGFKRREEQVNYTFRGQNYLHDVYSALFD